MSFSDKDLQEIEERIRFVGVDDLISHLVHRLRSAEACLGRLNGRNTVLNTEDLQFWIVWESSKVAK